MRFVHDKDRSFYTTEKLELNVIVRYLAAVTREALYLALLSRLLVDCRRVSELTAVRTLW